MSNRHQLFSDTEWATVAALQRRLLDEEVGRLDEDRLLNTSLEDLARFFAEKYKITIPLLLRDKIVVDQWEAQVDISSDRTKYVRDRSRPFLVPGTRIEVTIPFEGEARYFHIRPSTATYNLPRGQIEDHSVILHVEGADLLLDIIRTQFQQTIDEIAQNLNYLRLDAERFNSNLFSYAHSLIARRRRKILTDRNLAVALAIVLRERSDAEAATVPEMREKLVPALPPASTSPYQPEPILSVKDYEQILYVLQKSVRLLFLSPSLLASLDDTPASEALLTSHFLLQLNSHFEGAAPGELFTYDHNSIFIRTEGKNVFIAACAIWSGPAKLVETLDQLTSYSSWRDAKATLLLFNRTSPNAEIQESIQTAAKSHPNFKRELLHLETIFPYIFAQRNESNPSDRNREILITILRFDLPQQGRP